MKKKGLLSLCAVLLALALALPAAPVLAENNAYVKYTDAGRINLRSGPAASYRVLAAIAPGTPLEVIGVEGKWAHVYVADPQGYGTLEGYMYVDYIEDLSGQITYSYPMNTSYSDPVSTSYSQYAFPYVTENTAMYVYTGNSGKLHLREYATQNARSLGLYPNGTQVTVLHRSGSWAYVDVYGQRGYMMLQYLSAQYSPYTPDYPTYGAVTKYVSTGNSGRLHLREYASQNSRSLGLYANGTAVLAIDLGNGWNYVKVNGLVGYMMSRYLSSYQPQPQPTPYNPGAYTLMYVCIANGHVSLRAEMSDSGSALGNYANGTPVYVIYNFGTWAYVYVGGQYGYMKMSWLGNSPYSPTPTAIPHPVNPIGTAVVRHPNGSFVYLRSSRSTADLDNVLGKVPSGAVVLVYQKDEWYSLIVYNGVTGYMVSSYLDMSGSIGGSVPAIPLTPAQPTPTPEPSASIPAIPLMPAQPTVPESPVTGAATVKNPNSTYVNLRYSQSTADNSNVLAQVPVGARVDVMEQYSSNWSKVRYNGVVGYMVSGYLALDGQAAPVSVPAAPVTPATPVSSDETSASISAIPLTPATPTGVTMRIVRNNGSNFVYLRSSMDGNIRTNIIMRVPNGTVVELLEIIGRWAKIRVNNVEGYMVATYLKTE